MLLQYTESWDKFGNIFLISSPQLIEFQNNRASSKYQCVVSEMHQKFQERKEDAAIQLHEQLEQLEK